jgi:putative membrane protein insertion efficiency factor
MCKPPYQGWLNTLGGDLASLAAFVGGATLLAALTPLPVPKAVLPLLGAGAGLWGVGVERGWARRATWPQSLLLVGWAAGVHAVLSLLVASAFDSAPLPLAARCAVIVVAGVWFPRGTSRLDRQEEGWRRDVRQGSPSGSVQLAHALGSWRPPALVAWPLLLLVPLDLALRAASLAAILGYQLTFSRLMPSACRYEPSCSRYGFEAYRHHTFLRASILTALRILRCSPLGSGGYDPIPPALPLLPGAHTEEPTL